MSVHVLDDIIERTALLTPEEQLKLAAYLVEKVRSAYLPQKPRRKWSEICGAAPSPLAGEDAQAWVSRTRREADQKRERQWSRMP